MTDLAASRPMFRSLKLLGDASIAKHSQGFFKTGPGEYGEGDKFLGIRVPVLRSQAKTFRDLTLDKVTQSLHSPWHEERLCALLILVLKYKRGTEEEREDIFQLYLANTAYVNNWDLVDSSAHYIVGAHLLDRERSLLYDLAVADSMWERRIAIIATWMFIRENEFDDVLALSEMLLDDSEDLIHKAVGWMLREMGKRDESLLKTFLRKHYASVPRTCLRYAIERFPEPVRKKYLKGEFS